MHLTLLKSKIHMGQVTGCKVDYEGSITLGEQLMDACGIMEYERVLVADVRNGARFETYALRGEGRQIQVNGAAAKLVTEGDKLIIMSFASMTEDEAISHIPNVLRLTEDNAIIR